MTSPLVSLAKSYPGERPGSYVTRGGEIAPIRATPGDLLRGSRLRPLLAYGSNASPPHLGRKLARAGIDAPITILRARLCDYDVVYSAHVSRLGSIPATIEPLPGCLAPVYVMLLPSADARAAIHATEIPHYGAGVVRGMRVVLEDGTAVEAPEIFLSVNGSLLLEGRPVGLAAIASMQSPIARLSETEILARVFPLLGLGKNLDGAIARLQDSPDLRRACSEKLAASSGRPALIAFEKNIPSWEPVA